MNSTRWYKKGIRNMNGAPVSSLLVSVALWSFIGAHSVNAEVNWTRKHLPGPNSGNQQTACLVVDIDKDGIEDIVVTERTKTPSVVWYKYNDKSWDRQIIDNTHLKPEAGGDRGVHHPAINHILRRRIGLPSLAGNLLKPHDAT